MTFKNLSEISTAIKKWQEAIKSADTAIEYLSCGNRFTFTRTQESGADLHVYPGAFDEGNNKKLYIFLISKDDDKKNHSDEYLFNAITQCEIEYDDSLHHPDEIPEREAKERIDLWNKNYAEWAKAQIKTKNGIFKAFNLPSSAIQMNKKYTTFFSLKDSAATANHLADLITIDSSSKKHPIFYDTVRPVPPFDFLPETDFYLLSK